VFPRVLRLCTILEPGKLTAVRACLPIAFVILLPMFACAGGGTGSDYPNAADDNPDHVQDAGRGPGGPPGGAGSLDAGSAQGEQDAAPSSMDPCADPDDAGDSGDADGGIPDANADAEVDASDGASDAGDAASDAEPASDASDAQVDTGANFPDAAGDADLPIADASSDAPHTTSDEGGCVQ
jgi:hypothetical protein